MNDTNTSHVINSATTSCVSQRIQSLDCPTGRSHTNNATNHPRQPLFFFFKSPQSPAEPQSGADWVTRGRDPEPPFTNSSTGTMHGLIMSHGASLFSLSVIMRFLFFFVVRTCRNYCFTPNYRKRPSRTNTAGGGRGWVARRPHMIISIHRR